MSSSAGSTHNLRERQDTGPAPIASPIERGIEKFNESLTKDPRKRILPATTTTTGSPLSSPSNKHVAACTLEELLEEVRNIEAQCTGQQSTRRRRVEGLLVTINEHARVIDVLIQQQPDITAVVWGAVRFLIGVAVTEINTTARIAEALIEIFKDLGRWNKYLELFEDSERVRDIASDLFSQVLNFLIRARNYYQTSRTFRHVKIGITPYPQKLDHSMKMVREHAKALGREVFLASEIKRENDRKLQAEDRILERREIEKQREFRKETSAQLGDTSNLLRQGALTSDYDRVDEFLRQGKSLSVCNIVPDGEEGTCSWILQCPAYNSWAANSYDRPLFICGLPGSSLIHSRRFMLT